MENSEPNKQPGGTGGGTGGTQPGEGNQPGPDAPNGEGNQPGPDAPNGEGNQPGPDAPNGEGNQPGPNDIDPAVVAGLLLAVRGRGHGRPIPPGNPVDALLALAAEGQAYLGWLP